MDAALQSVIGNGVNLPEDLLPDDTTLLYDQSGRPSVEIDYDDSDDEMVADSKVYDRYANLALAYYNDKHHTDYKAVRFLEGRRMCFEIVDDIIHCGFTAVQATVVGCESSNKNFLTELKQAEDNDVVVVSCCIVDGPKTIGCRSCDYLMWEPHDSGENGMESNGDLERQDMEANHTESWEDDPLFSQYAHSLANEVSLSDKARARLPYPLLALAYYNKKHGKDYKLVDALPFCASIENAFVIHCNFIARLNAPDDDVSNKLFFTELEKRKKGWVVTACRILHGCKTMAGCHNCGGRKGKRVVHPTHGFRFGFHRPVYRNLRRRRC